MSYRVLSSGEPWSGRVSAADLFERARTMALPDLSTDDVRALCLEEIGRCNANTSRSMTRYHELRAELHRRGER